MKNKSYSKNCKKCSSKLVIKFWMKRWKQRYKCKSCNHVFVNKNRPKKATPEKLWKDYVFWKQTYKQLSEKYWLSIKTVQKYLDQYNLPEVKVVPQEIVLLIDTTYFWNIWIMAFKDYNSKKILKFKLVSNETYASYLFWVNELKQEWWKIKAIVCDWKRWLLWGFWNIPTQMCNFHQVQIVTRYITKRPRLQANKDLRELTLLLTKTDKETFSHYLNLWHIQYADFIGERWINEEWKRYYIHKRTRSAYKSLKNNLYLKVYISIKYLFTWYDYLWKIDIPNTTNWLEWFFSHLKTKVRVHSWLKKERKVKLTLSLLHGTI